MDEAPVFHTPEYERYFLDQLIQQYTTQVDIIKARELKWATQTDSNARQMLFRLQAQPDLIPMVVVAVNAMLKAMEDDASAEPLRDYLCSVRVATILALVVELALATQTDETLAKEYLLALPFEQVGATLARQRGPDGAPVRPSIAQTRAAVLPRPLVIPALEEADHDPD